MTVYGLGQKPRNALGEIMPPRFIDVVKKRAQEMQEDGTLAAALTKSGPFNVVR